MKKLSRQRIKGELLLKGKCMPNNKRDAIPGNRDVGSLCLERILGQIGELKCSSFYVHAAEPLVFYISSGNKSLRSVRDA